MQYCTIALVLQNELAILEFIHCLVETLDRYFSNVCELDLMFNLEMVSKCACMVHSENFEDLVMSAVGTQYVLLTYDIHAIAGSFHC